MGDTVYRSDALEEWEAYFDRLDRAGPYHEPAYLLILEEFMGASDRTAELFVYEDDDGFVYYPYFVRPLADLPFAEASDLDLDRYSDLVSSWYYGGPIASPGATASTVESFRDAFEAHCEDSNVVSEFVRYDPNLANHDTFGCMHAEFDRETVPVDLTQSREELWDGFEKRNRNAIRQGQDSPLSVEPTTDPDEYAAFHDIYADAMAARDASEHYRFPSSFFERLLSREDRATLLVARDGDTVVGGSLVVHDGHVGHDYIRVSNPDYWDQRVNNLLCYEAMMHVRELGHECHDFQGGRPGVFKFKKAFSPDRREFHVGKEVHLPSVYDRLLEDAAAAGVETEKSYFPAYRIERSN